MGSEEEYSSAYVWRYFNNITEDMEAGGKVHYANLVVKQGTTGFTSQPMKADETYTIYIGALGENKVNAVTFNGMDVTDQVFEGYYTTPRIKKESVLSISYEHGNDDDAIHQVKALGNVRVLGGDGEITIANLEEPAEVRVYAEDGKMVASERVLNTCTIRVQTDQVYIVKVGDRSFKVAI